MAMLICILICVKAYDKSVKTSVVYSVSGGNEGEVPREGLEPTPPCGERILSPPRLPFRHLGKK